MSRLFSAPRLLAAVLVASFGLLNGCAGAIQSSLEDSPRNAWPEGLTLRYLESGGSLGTRDVLVDGARIVEQRTRPGLSASAVAGETEEAGVLERSAPADPAALRRLVETLVEIEAWDQAASDDLGQPPIDAHVAKRTLSRNGERTEVWEWAHELELTDRIVRVRRLIDSMLAN